MSQQHLQAVYIVHEQLFDRARALILNEPQRELFKALLQGGAQTEEGMICGLVGYVQPPAVQNRLQHQADQNANHPYGCIAAADRSSQD